MAMKIRRVKLREAHSKINGAKSFCCVLWDNEAKHIVTSSSSESVIAVHDPLLPSASPKILRHHSDGVTALSLSPNSTCLASGSIDRSVKLYKFPGGEFQTNVTRFTLPIRVLAFNKSGSILAAAGDDEGIKLINTIDGSIARVLKGHRGSVTGVEFDPNSEYLASVDSIGTVIIWELLSGTAVHTLKSIAPDTGLDFSALNVLCWSPDGETLAVPGLRNDVVIYDRDTAEKLYSLRGDHMQRICFLAWSPNGQYMATSGIDQQLLIWEVDQRQDICRHTFDETICCMAWKPTGNSLAVIDVMGNYGVWDSVIPSSMKSPTEGLLDLKYKNSNGLLFIDEEDQDLSASCSLSDLGGGSHGDSIETSRKRIRKSYAYDARLEVDDVDEVDTLTKTESHRAVHPKKSASNGNGRCGTVLASAGINMQEAFQPGFTPSQPGKRHFLCYNMLGCITTRENDGCSHVEIEFHDTGRGPRVPSMTDYFGFSMAALNEYGSVFASEMKGNNKISTLMYRPFSSWANNSEWSMRFEGEEVKAVALGTGWVAAVTSLNFLRIFTEGGLQRSILSLDGPVVTAAGLRDQLAVVTHASHCLPSGDQMLEFRLFNIRKGTLSLRGNLPLTPGSFLNWFGFSEEGYLSYYDSKGSLRMYTNQFGGSWFPIFSSIKTKTNNNYWVVGLNAKKLFCIVCKSPDLYPQVMPKPVLTLLDFSFPLASSDLGAEGLENEFMLNNLHLSQIETKIEEMASTGKDTAALDDEAFDVEAAQDKCILKLISYCCNGDKLVRATELVKHLSMEKSVKGAIKLVTTMKLPNLAERFSSILEERMRENANESNDMTTLRSSEFTNPEVASHTMPTCPKSSEGEENIKSVSPMLVKKSSLEDDGNVKQSNSSGNCKDKSERMDKRMSVREGASASNIRNREDQPKRTIEVANRVEISRPSNPFAKSVSGTNQKSSSLLESLKKMKAEGNFKN
uniref:WD repeat and HMG-box DNA-binding protein 1 n=1 Tax=Kalanchoe fedtschenkoi TaxID=63787 RepID=A0A7N0RC00_KALFE